MAKLTPKPQGQIKPSATYGGTAPRRSSLTDGRSAPAPKVDDVSTCTTMKPKTQNQVAVRKG